MCAFLEMYRIYAIKRPRRLFETRRAPVIIFAGYFYVTFETLLYFNCQLIVVIVFLILVVSGRK